MGRKPDPGCLTNDVPPVRRWVLLLVDPSDPICSVGGRWCADWILEVPRKKHVLLIDDDIRLAGMLQRYLSGFGVFWS